MSFQLLFYLEVNFKLYTQAQPVGGAVAAWQVHVFTGGQDKVQRDLPSVYSCY